jgi:hypothetical protein
MAEVKADAAGGWPACVPPGSPNLVAIDAPPVEMTDVDGPTRNTAMQPVPVGVTGAPAQLTTQFGCTDVR